MKIFINIPIRLADGTNIDINAPTTINGPNGMYSSIFLIFVINNITLNTAPIKNETNVIANQMRIRR